MFLNALSIKDVRSYKQDFFEFSPSLNVIVGDNAVGKTTILEVIWLLMTGRSFRTPYQKEMIRFGENQFTVQAFFVKHSVEQKLKVQVDQKNKQFFCNQTKLNSASALLGNLLGVVMIPEDTSLIKGSPKARRAFLDLYLAQKDPLYVHHLNRFFRAMQQRNCLLRANQVNALFPWELEMATSAVYLTKRRVLAVEQLNVFAKTFFSFFSKKKERLSLIYQTLKEPLEEESYLKAFKKMLKKELALGATLTGPHKDDLQILIEDKEAKFFGSEGQLRCATAAMLLAEWETLKQESGETPLMLVDDFAISLDETRKCLLLEVLESLGQVFLTTTKKIDPKRSSHAHTIFRTLN